MSRNKSLTPVLSILALLALSLSPSLAKAMPDEKEPGSACEIPLSARVARKVLMPMVKGALSLRYDVELKGAEPFLGKKNEKVLIIASHPSYTNPPIDLSQIDPIFYPRPVMKENMATHWASKFAADVSRAILIPDLELTGRDGLSRAKGAMDVVIDSLNRGDNVLIYPTAKLMRGYLEDMRANSGIETIVKAVPGVRVVFLRSRGLWGSSFSYAPTGKSPAVWPAIWQASKSVLAGAAFWVPKRKVTLEIFEPADFPRDGDRKTINRYIEAQLNHEAPPAIRVPYYRWEDQAPIILPEHKSAESAPKGNPADVSPAIRGSVYEYLKGKLKSAELKDGDSLDSLGMDSLGQVELALWIGKEFNLDLPASIVLNTVGDVVLAAAGQYASSGPVELKPVPRKWKKATSTHAGLLSLPDDAKTLPEAVWHQARLNPDKVVLADQMRGAWTYRDLMQMVMLFKPTIQDLSPESDNVGILLPPSNGATMLLLATQWAGKVPVNINFTTGKSPMGHAVRSTGTKVILTSRMFIEKLKGMRDSGGNLIFDFSEIESNFVYLEDVKNSFTFKRRAILSKAKMWHWTMWRDLYKSLEKVKETSVILFTSGSSGNPKGVPLTHRNQLADLEGMLKLVPFNTSDKMIAFVPPFHSLGATGTQVLTLAVGLPTVYYPDAKDGKGIASMIEHYGVTLVPGTPTFLNFVLNAAKPEQLQSVRMAVVGAEKCKDAVYNAFKLMCPNAKILEGYGITETSPLISINSWENPKAGTVGPVIEGLDFAIVDLDTLSKRVARGSEGVLLVKGETVFSGYLDPASGDPFIEFEGERWFNTKDIVDEDPVIDRHLTIRGRISRFAKIGGEMIPLDKVEGILDERFRTPEDQGPFLVVEQFEPQGAAQPELVLAARRPISMQEANEAIRAAGLSALHNVRRVIQVNEIPVLGTGKTDYKTIKANVIDKLE